MAAQLLVSRKQVESGNSSAPLVFANRNTTSSHSVSNTSIFCCRSTSTIPHPGFSSENMRHVHEACRSASLVDTEMGQPRGTSATAERTRGSSERDDAKHTSYAMHDRGSSRHLVTNLEVLDANLRVAFKRRHAACGKQHAFPWDVASFCTH
jgi:hypothetical protein